MGKTHEISDEFMFADPIDEPEGWLNPGRPKDLARLVAARFSPEYRARLAEVAVQATIEATKPVHVNKAREVAELAVQMVLGLTDLPEAAPEADKTNDEPQDSNVEGEQ